MICSAAQAAYLLLSCLCLEREREREREREERLPCKVPWSVPLPRLRTCYCPVSAWRAWPSRTPWPGSPKTATHREFNYNYDLILRDIRNSITPQTTLRLLPIPVGLLVLPCTCQCRQSPLTPSPFFFLMARTEEPAKAGTCAHDRHVLQTACSECAR